MPLDGRASLDERRRFLHRRRRRFGGSDRLQVAVWPAVTTILLWGVVAAYAAVTR